MRAKFKPLEARATAQEALSSDDLKAILRRFHAINRDRLNRIRQHLSLRQQHLINALALLLHSNHPGLPGFVSRDTPCGISGYVPGKQDIAATRVLARSADLKHRMPMQMSIEALFFMGSIGSIAYSRKSDFDIWLCHRADLSGEAIQLLEKKTDAISRFADELGLEMHFFLMSSENVRAGRYASMSQESSGSAQHHLLMDEFYRTAVLLAGRYPLWWLVPPDQENNYQAYTRNLFEKRFIRNGDAIDLGEVSSIAASEFFGASLWQLYKAVYSPYKSLLKILLLEAYASQYPRIDLLCAAYKRSVYAGRIKMADLDPYLLMMRRVEAYLLSRGESDRLQLARRSFYFKLNRRLSEKLGDDDPHIHALQDQVQQWQWDRPALKVLDARPSWKITRVQQERRLIVNSLMQSYKHLSAFARKQKDLMTISQKDMNLLGRRLFAAFERKSGKVELINPGISDDLSEPHLFLAPGQHGGWTLYRHESSHFPAQDNSGLQSEPNCIKLLAWTYFNGLANRNTDIKLHSSKPGFEQRNIRDILLAMDKQFAELLPFKPETKAFHYTNRPLASCIFVNVDDTGNTQNKNLQGLISQYNDPLNFGSGSNNLVTTLDCVTLSSWGEVLTQRFQDQNALLNWLCRQMDQVCRGRQQNIYFQCFTPDHGERIRQRLQSLCTDMFQQLSDKNWRGSRYLSRINGSYVLFDTRSGQTQFKPLQGMEDLYTALSDPCPTFTRLAVDPHLNELQELRILGQANQPERIQILYRTETDQADIYIADENGSVFRDRVPFYREDLFVSQFSKFIEQAMYRENAERRDGDAVRANYPLEFFQLVTSRNGDLRRRDVKTSSNLDDFDAMQLQVIGQELDGQRGFSIFCDGIEFSTLVHGKRLFNTVAEYIVSLRSGSHRYPIHITDIDLTHIITDRSPGDLQTVDYLRYKHFIESKLNHAIREEI